MENLSSRRYRLCQLTTLSTCQFARNRRRLRLWISTEPWRNFLPPNAVHREFDQRGFCKPFYILQCFICQISILRILNYRKTTTKKSDTRFRTRTWLWRISSPPWHTFTLARSVTFSVNHSFSDILTMAIRVMNSFWYGARPWSRDKRTLVK